MVTGFSFHSLPDTTIATIRGTTSTRTQRVGHCFSSDSDLTCGGSRVGRFDLVEAKVAWCITFCGVPKTARWIWLWAVEPRKCALKIFVVCPAVRSRPVHKDHQSTFTPSWDGNPDLNNNLVPQGAFPSLWKSALGTKLGFNLTGMI